MNTLLSADLRVICRFGVIRLATEYFRHRQGLRLSRRQRSRGLAQSDQVLPEEFSGKLSTIVLIAFNRLTPEHEELARDEKPCPYFVPRSISLKTSTAA
jgi:hypothetical protein